MNSSPEGPQTNFELPPQPAQSPEVDAQRQERAAKAPAAAPEQAGKQAKAPALPDNIPTVDTPVIAIPVSDDPTKLPASDHPANDSERIEPVWVDKAKAVVYQTKDDPYQQKIEMSKVKAEYIQKRFNKQVKTDEF